MGNKTRIKLLLLLFAFSNVNAGVRITEIMPGNVATIYSEKYDYNGYVELYNDGGEVDLKGWTVTNIKEGEINWSVKLDSTHIVPNGYSLLFFGDEESSSTTASRVQKNFIGSVKNKLTADEGVISFTKDDKLMELFYPKQYPHIAYSYDGYMHPTPGKENDKLTTDISNRVSTPQFIAAQPGFHEETVSVELGCEMPDAKIFYTLNGDIPTIENGMLYAGPISFDTSTVVRARAYKNDMLYSEILTGSFIFSDPYYDYCRGTGVRLPIVSIAANNKDFFDDMLGIYVVGKNGKSSCDAVANYNQDWMRSANFEYFLDGKCVDNQEVEVGVYGGCTRVHNAKSLKIKANKRAGKNKLQYDNFFPDRSYKKYKSIALRNGGNGYSYVQPRWRDMFIQSLADGMNLDKQEFQPVSYYLNGTFYGMMILAERTGPDFVYHNYGLEEDEIDFISVLSCEAGTKEAYNKMIDYVSKNYQNEEFYDKLNEMMDIDEYIDYQILEQYVGNTDWVSNNIKFWRKHDGGRFRWIVFDTDFGLSAATSVDKDMIKFATSEKGWESCWVLLRSCLKNEDFRWKFLDQYLDRIENQFSDAQIDAKLDSIWDLTRLDMCATIKNSAFLGAPGSLVEFEEIVERMRSFAKERKMYVVDQLKKEFGLGDEKVVLKVRTVFTNGSNADIPFLINKREFQNAKLNTWTYINERVKVEPIVPYGYRINHWLLNNVPVKNEDGSIYTGSYLTEVADSSELKISIFFEKDPSCTLPTDLCLNEICASNASTLNEIGEASDWIELYNGSDQDIDIAGMIIENRTKEVQCTIPTGDVATIIPAHSYKLLWADKKPELGTLHLNFKLGASASEQIVLLANYEGQDVVLSSITYIPHATDESYGRESDGALTMSLFSLCEESDGSETMTSTPLAANGSIICSNSVSAEQVVSDHVQVFVQDKKLYILNAQGSDVHIFSMLGDMVVNQRITSDSYTTSIATPGVYLVKVQKECWKIRVE